MKTLKRNFLDGTSIVEPSTFEAYSLTLTCLKGSNVDGSIVRAHLSCHRKRIVRSFVLLINLI